MMAVFDTLTLSDSAVSKTLAIAQGDWYVNPRGQGDLIQDHDKAVQDFGMFLMCDQHSNLNKLIGRAQVSKSSVSAAIQTATQKLQSAQSADSKCTSGERITGLHNLELAIDGRDVYFVVDASTADRDSVTIADGIQYRRQEPGVSSGYTQKQLNDVVMTKVV